VVLRGALNTNSPPGRVADRRLFLFSAIAISAIIFAGFAHSYYLKAWLGSRVLTAILHVHGLIMTAWIVLFLTQTLLVANHRTSLHRKLGMLGAVLTGSVLAIGSLIVFKAIYRRYPEAGAAQASQLFVAYDGLNLLVFTGLVCTALYLRWRSDVHKRLMLIATVSLLPPAMGRIIEQLAKAEAPMVILALMIACVVACLVFDTLKNRRLHPALGWSGALLIASSALTYFTQIRS
jgi:hypothetical protein